MSTKQCGTLFDFRKGQLATVSGTKRKEKEITIFSTVELCVPCSTGTAQKDVEISCHELAWPFLSIVEEVDLLITTFTVSYSLDT
eukprot:scaffold421748_cov67-Attheya_sp.AAC.1